MKARLLLILSLMLLTLAGNAQGKKHHSAKKIKPKKVMVSQLPSWYPNHDTVVTVSHIYFPDYYAFYDANRHGFVSWAHNRWEFSPTVPLYLKNVDLSKSRIKILKGLSLDLHPETNYPNYMKLYPADPKLEPIDVPVPTITRNR